jgi:hypothetical protein
MGFNFHGFLVLFHPSTPRRLRAIDVSLRASRGLFMMMMMMVVRLAGEGPFRLGPVVVGVN